MKEAKKYRFRNLESDLEQEIRGSKDFELVYKTEAAKLKIAEKLMELREKMGWSQADLARRMQVSQQLISRIESGSDNVTVETLVKFFHILGVHLRIGIRKRRRDQEILEFIS